MDLICQKWDLYYADALNSLHITKAVDYTDLFMKKKKKKRQQVKDQLLITSLSLSLTIV